jgi:osmotically-inducible protein OsmY
MAPTHQTATDKNEENRHTYPHRTPGQIHDDIVNHLAWDNRIEGADVEVSISENNVVTLNGTAPSYIVRQAAGEDVLMIPGVRGLNNQIRVRLETPTERHSDDELEHLVSMVIDLDPNMDRNKVAVSVQAGVVTLSGVVDSFWKKLRCEEITFNVAGVEQVRNSLAVVPTHAAYDESVARSIALAIERTEAVAADMVSVEVSNGHVKLAGTVPDWQAWKAVQSAAEHTHGVTDITNTLAVRS